MIKANNNIISKWRL